MRTYFLISHLVGTSTEPVSWKSWTNGKKIWKPRYLSVEVIDKSNNKLGHGFFQDKSELFLCYIFDPSFSRFKWKCNYTDYERWRWVKRFVKPMSGTVSTWSNQ